VLPGVETATARTLPSPYANCTTPECQLPNWPANGSVTLRASGKAVWRRTTTALVGTTPALAGPFVTTNVKANASGNPSFGA